MHLCMPNPILVKSCCSSLDYMLHPWQTEDQFDWIFLFIFHALTLTELKTVEKTKINWKLEEQQEEDAESIKYVARL